MKAIGLSPRLVVDAAGSGVVSQAGGALLVETVRAAGLGRALPDALAPWRKPGAVHDPAKVVLDLAVMLALGGDCLADVALLRAEPGVYGRVASDPTVSRVVAALGADAPRVHRTPRPAPTPRARALRPRRVDRGHPTPELRPPGRWSSTWTPPG